MTVLRPRHGYKVFEGHSHYCVIGSEGWKEVADYALEWAVEHAAVRPAVGAHLLQLTRDTGYIYRFRSGNERQLEEIHQDQAAYKDLEPPAPQNTHRSSSFPRLGSRIRNTACPSQCPSTPHDESARCRTQNRNLMLAAPDLRVPRLSAQPPAVARSTNWRNRGL